MNKKSLIKKPVSGYRSFIDTRKKELYALLALDPSEINDLAKEEWNLMPNDDKIPYVELARSQKTYFDSVKDQILEVEVDSFMSSIKEARKQKDVEEEFQEDDILSIINHKKKWRQTWSRKKKEALRLQKSFSPFQAKKIAKLKLN